MIRYITVILIIWGLTVQPVMSSMISIAGASESADPQVMKEDHQRARQDTNKLSSMPCEKRMSSDMNSTDEMDCCDGEGCQMTDVCDVVCSMSIVAIINIQIINFEFQKNSTYRFYSMDSIDDQSSIIFHPPKHS